MAIIISADKIKETLSGYSPEKAALFHEESARLADTEFTRILKTCSEERVVVMAGGSASGKTEYVSAYLENQDMLVFDGTLPTFQGAKIKIRRALKTGKKVEIHLILPDSIPKAFFAFLNRKRKFSALNFYKTHAGARQTVLKIARQCPEIIIKIFISHISSVDIKTMSFEELEFQNRHQIVEYLADNQYTKAEIRREINEYYL